jgi:hypothetical protein
MDHAPYRDKKVVRGVFVRFRAPLHSAGNLPCKFYQFYHWSGLEWRKEKIT